MEELDYVISGLKKNKAPGPDEVRAEIILLLKYWGQQELRKIINQCIREQKVPQSWKEALIVSIYPGRGLDSDPANYRPISLLNTFYKFYASLLQIRLAAAHDHHLRDTQYGFRAARSTSDPLFILRRAQDLSIKTDLPLCLLFLDWKMAFDKVDHRSMALALQRLRVHRHYVDAIGDLYTDQTFTVKGFQNGSITATPHTGIRQGCPLGPYLFIMFMTLLFYDVDKRLRTTGVPTNTWSIGKPIYDLEHADDTLLLSVTPPQMEYFLKSVQVEASLYSMLNMAKTELLADNGSTPPVYFVDGTPVLSSGSAKYLGSHITCFNPTQKAIDARKALTHSRYMKLQPLWRSRLSRATKVKMYKASIVPSLTYGLDTLSLEVRHSKTIDAWYYQHLRRSISIEASYYSRVSNNQVWIQAGRPTVPSQQLVSSQLRQFANILTSSTSDPRYHVVFSPRCKDRVKFNKGTKGGHPRRYWLELITETALPVIKEYAEYTAQEHRHDVLSIRQMLNRDTGFKEYLLSAPTRQKSFLHDMCSIWDAHGSRDKRFQWASFVPVRKASAQQGLRHVGYAAKQSTQTQAHEPITHYTTENPKAGACCDFMSCDVGGSRRADLAWADGRDAGLGRCWTT